MQVRLIGYLANVPVKAGRLPFSFCHLGEVQKSLAANAQRVRGKRLFLFYGPVFIDGLCTGRLGAVCFAL